MSCLQTNHIIVMAVTKPNYWGMNSHQLIFFLGGFPMFCFCSCIFVRLFVCISGWLPLPLPHPMFPMLYCWLFSPGHPLPLTQCHSFVHSSTRPSYHKVPFWICDPWQVHFGYVSPLIFLKLANAGQILTQNAIMVFSTIFSFIHPCFELLCFFTFFYASFVNEGW